MQLELIRLVSTDWNGIGNDGNAMLDLIYTYLIQEKGLGYYHHIKINQISAEGMNDIIFDRNSVHINFVYNVSPDFASFSALKKNEIRLDIIHNALLALGQQDSRFESDILEEIRAEIIKKQFVIEIEYFNHRLNKRNDIGVSLLVIPSPMYFDFFLVLQENFKQMFHAHVFRGKPSDYYIDMLFSKSQWKTDKEFVLSGSERQMQLTLILDGYQLKFENLTSFPKPPLWEMMKFHSQETEGIIAYENWIHSLPPAYAAMLRQAGN